jgi:tripartite-type tricarboxylate transporter receptor subunit TctC
MNRTSSMNAVHNTWTSGNSWTSGNTWAPGRCTGRFARLVTGAIAVLAFACVLANAFPDRPIKLIVGFGAGGPTDILARTLADQLSDGLGAKVVVENKSGAAGNIATQFVASAEADGHTYLIGASPLAVNHTLFPDFPVKYGRDLTAVSPLGATANVLVVHPSLNIRTLADFVAHARARPGSISYATVGVGSSSHLAGVAFDLRAGTAMVPVNYRGGGEAAKDLLGGHIQAWFAPIPSVLEAIRTKQLVAVAATGPRRASWLPDVPTVAELGFDGFDVRLWVGVFAPSSVPDERLRVVETAIGRAIASRAMGEILETQGIAPLQMTRAEFDAFVVREIERWRPVVAALKR